MSLADEHEAIWRTPHETALLLLKNCPDPHPGIDTLREHLDSDAETVFYQLKSSGHIRSDQPLSTDARLTRSGLRLAEHVELSCVPGEPRWDDELGRLVLVWLIQTPDAGALDEFLSDGESQRQVFGSSVTRDDLERWETGFVKWG